MAKNFWTAQQAYSWAVFGDETIIGSRNSPSRQLRRFEDVRATIRNSIAKELLVGSVLVNQQRHPLDPQQFRDYPNMAIDEYGDIVPLVPYRTRELPTQGRQALFSVRETKSIFPNGIDHALVWMHGYMKRNPMAKKEAAVTDFRNETGLSVRAANEAWRKIAPELGRGPGRRISRCQ